jgi:hypothetical protein
MAQCKLDMNWLRSLPTLNKCNYPKLVIERQKLASLGKQGARLLLWKVNIPKRLSTETSSTTMNRSRNSGNATACEQPARSRASKCSKAVAGGCPRARRRGRRALLEATTDLQSCPSSTCRPWRSMVSRSDAQHAHGHLLASAPCRPRGGLSTSGRVPRGSRRQCWPLGEWAVDTSRKKIVLIIAFEMTLGARRWRLRGHGDWIFSDLVRLASPLCRRLTASSFSAPSTTL